MGSGFRVQKLTIQVGFFEVKSKRLFDVVGE